LGKTDIDAWTATFPERYDRLLKSGIKREDIYPHASMYKSNKLVVALMEQSLVPSYILNAPLHQQALAEAANMMINARSEMAKAKAIELVLNYTKAPETSKIKIDLGVQDVDAIADLRKVTQELAAAQMLAIKSGASSVREIAESTIIEVEDC
jgi:hypothetical protein